MKKWQESLHGEVLSKRLENTLIHWIYIVMGFHKWECPKMGGLYGKILLEAGGG
jgi:hypothetical protein